MSKLVPFNDEINLHVYKASAGSGKTHRLTEEYLRLLFSSPYAYRHILAVTFTNKATDEMKTRIVDELANLALDRKSDYLAILSEEYGYNESQVRKEARDILVRILHDYSAFSVSTIDKFFQQTMRAFTREIGLGGGYNIELDTDKVLGEAIDSMLYDLERTDNKLLLDWLIRFSEEKVENGETWNIRNDIQSLSKEILKESYKAYSNQVQSDISDKQLMTDYKDMLFAIIRTFESTVQQIGEKALNIMTRYGVKPDDFKGTSRSPFFSFLKWANGGLDEPSNPFRALADNISNWYLAKTPTDVKERIESAYNELNVCICDIIAHFDNSLTYQTAYEINRYFFTLGILGDVDRKIRENAAVNNVMLISDTTELLNRIIDGNDSPFIYEKVGQRVNHYMIDEFQDTSGMQWQNFLPLVRDSLAGGNRNFIVGDVKQSIYRWRNSDWKLLDEQLDRDFENEGINHETLDTNWRSSRNVIAFNNTVFSVGAKLLQDVFNKTLNTEDNLLKPFLSRIEKAYNALFQHIPDSHKDNEGRVKVEFIDTDEYNWQEYVLEQLPECIEQLQDRGYKLKDIAILVRTKKEGADVANRLLEYKSQNPDSQYRYDIISDEALFVSNSKSIKLVIALLKYMHNPADASLRALAVFEYLKYSDQLSTEDALQRYFSGGDDLPEEVRKALDYIRELPLYEMTEQIFELFHRAMNDDEQVYIQSFLDMVLDYSIRNSSDLDAFLKWWDETGVNKTIFTPDGQDAIRIMTIHKSKGLGFNVVLVPFCNWEIDHKLTTILWCHPTINPFDRLHLVPVKYSQKLKNTIFSYEYFNERLHAFIDNVNILYVAFTRAKNELIAFAPRPKRDDVNNIASLLWQCINSSSEPMTDKYICLSLPEGLDEETGIFEIGENYLSEEKEKTLSIEEVTVNKLSNIAYEERISLLLKNKYFFTDSGQRDYGTLMHEIVSKVQTIDDIEDVVSEYYIAGSITSDQKKDLENMLTGYLSDPLVATWYSGQYRVLNEVEILQPKGRVSRPDRVMVNNDEVIVIDYKFGEKESNKYNKQVKYYIDQIRKMGYAKVKGYICYIALNKVIEIL